MTPNVEGTEEWKKLQRVYFWGLWLTPYQSKNFYTVTPKLLVVSAGRTYSGRNFSLQKVRLGSNLLSSDTTVLPKERKVLEPLPLNKLFYLSTHRLEWDQYTAEIPSFPISFNQRRNDTLRDRKPVYRQDSEKWPRSGLRKRPHIK